MFKFSDVPNLILESIRDPQEGATRVLSFAPPREALWLLLALVAVLSTLMSQVAFVLSGASADASMGTLMGTPVGMAALQALFIVGTVYLVYWVGRACGGQGSFEETLLLVVWLQVIFVAVQLAQLVLAIIAPFLTLLVLVASVGLFFYLLTYFVLVLHRFQSAGMVFAGIVISGFGTLFVLGLAMSILGIGPETLSTGGTF